MRALQMFCWQPCTVCLHTCDYYPDYVNYNLLPAKRLITKQQTARHAHQYPSYACELVNTIEVISFKILNARQCHSSCSMGLLRHNKPPDKMKSGK